MKIEDGITTDAQWPIDPSHEQWLYLLKNLYLKLINILDAFTNAPIAFPNTQINGEYTAIKEAVDTLLKMAEFKTLQKLSPKLFPSLIQNYEGYDRIWINELENKTRAFFAELEREWILAGGREFELPEAFSQRLVFADKAIETHKQLADTAWRNARHGIDNEVYMTLVLPDLHGPMVIKAKDGEVTLIQPNYQGDNDRFIRYLAKNPNRFVPTDELRAGCRTKKPFTKMVNELGFKGVLKQAFFPVVSDKKGVLFRPAVSLQELANDNIDRAAIISEFTA